MKEDLFERRNHRDLKADLARWRRIVAQGLTVGITGDDEAVDYHCEVMDIAEDAMVRAIEAETRLETIAYMVKSAAHAITPDGLIVVSEMAESVKTLRDYLNRLEGGETR